MRHRGIREKVMTPQEIKKAVLKYKWEWWAERRDHRAFILSLFQIGQARKYMRLVGVDAEWPATLFQKSCYYKSDATWSIFARQINRYLESGGSIFEVIKRCEQYRCDGICSIKRLIEERSSVLEKLGKLREILALDISFIWIAHGLEYIYKKILHQEIPKHYTGDIEKFIGDISYPAKKNAHWYLEQALRSKSPLIKVKEKFAWIKSRDGFSNGFSIIELVRARKQLLKTRTTKFIRPKIPTGLKNLARATQELVYFRTLRTDVLYELLYLSRPILCQVADRFHIPFKELADYAIDDLIAGKPRKYPRTFACLTYGKDAAFFRHPVLHDTYGRFKKLKGVVAMGGVARGKAKIVRTVHEIGKIKRGDILFAPTTAPSYIMGMRKAIAFVTDEGGITSHAAIVSREMKKPCVIGTKIATKVFKDGDLVEVDANKGIVTKISKS
jgi:phosphohistidine swiveling domain-containing protein